MSQSFINNTNSFNETSTNINCTLADDHYKILARLFPVYDIRIQCLDGIRDWLLETKEFRSWYNRKRKDGPAHTILSCYGDPGVGKSYITSLAIDKICDEAMEQDNAVACFYFDFTARNWRARAATLSCTEGYMLVVLDSLREILQRSPNTRIFMTGRPSSVLIQPIEKDIIKYLREGLGNGQKVGG